jgi:hypothetical protein
VRDASVSAFRTGMVVSALLMIAGAILAAAGIENPPRTHGATPPLPEAASV